MLVEIDRMREALASYIEATYHLSNPKLVDLRRRLLTQGGIAQTPYVESTPTYVGDRKFASLAVDETVRNFLTNLATKESEQLLFDPPYEHQAQALEATVASAGGTGIVITTGTGSGKTEGFLLPIFCCATDQSRVGASKSPRPAPSSIADSNWQQQNIRQISMSVGLSGLRHKTKCALRT
jgi:ATP-dependent helicase YprA (DUF1998 family)